MRVLNIEPDIVAFCQKDFLSIHSYKLYAFVCVYLVLPIMRN